MFFVSNPKFDNFEQNFVKSITKEMKSKNDKNKDGQAADSEKKKAKARKRQSELKLFHSIFYEIFVLKKLEFNFNSNSSLNI